MPRSTSAPDPEIACFALFTDATRLALVRALAPGPESVNNLAARLGAELTTVSHHLGVMREGGLVTATKIGRHVVYSLVGGAVTGDRLVVSHRSGVQVVISLERVRAARAEEPTSEPTE